MADSAGPAGPPAGRVVAVVAARNEAPTVGGVVDAARSAESIDEVIVVVNASVDATASVAAAHGARVIVRESPGKGEAMAAGVRASDAPVVVFLDADLVGLRPDHVDRLVSFVATGQAGMACGLFDRGRWQNLLFLYVFPVLTGQRALRREVFEGLSPADVRGYKVEASLNSACAELGLRRVDFVCDGLWHRTKEEKYPPVVGFVLKQAMLLTAVWAYVSYRLRRRVRRRLGRDRA